MRVLHSPERRSPSTRIRHEKNVSAQHHQACAHSRFPCSKGDPRRPRRACRSPSQGQGPAQRLSRPGLSGEPADSLADSQPSSSVAADDASFPRSARILNGATYAPVFRKNARLGDRFWTVLVHDCDDGTARLGLAIAKKRARRAVDRNRLKRIARDSFRHHRHRLGSRRFVVMNRDAATAAPSGELRVALDRLWSRVIAGRYR